MTHRPSVLGRPRAVTFWRTAAVAVVSGGLLLTGPAGNAGGPHWSVQPTARSLTDSGFLGVDCSNPTSCVAVGQRAESGIPLIEAWNGSKWTQQRSAYRDGSARLDAVSCPSTTWCMAIGNLATPLFEEPFVAETWNGTSWTPTTQPLAIPYGSGGGTLNRLTCPAVDDCMAVGEFFYSNSPSIKRPLTEIWNGAQWSWEAAYVPNGSFNDVSCTQGFNCVAVGYTQDDSGNTIPLATYWSDGWIVLSNPDPLAKSAVLTGISCPQDRMCTAVGYETGSKKPLAVSWNGREWTKHGTVGFGPNYVPRFNAVSCSDYLNCTAVGERPSRDHTSDVPFVETWNGTEWTFQQTPRLSAPVARLNDISCPTAFCMAVGIKQPSKTTSFPLAEVRE